MMPEWFEQCAKRSDKGVTIEVRVQPRASKQAVEGVDAEGRLRVRLTAPPADGAANKQLIELLADELGCPKSSLSILRGQSARVKLVLVEGV